MQNRQGEQLYDPDDPRDGPDGWSTAHVDTDPDNDTICTVTFTHPDGAVCKILQHKYDSYGVALETPGDGEDLGDVFGVEQDATRTAYFGMQAYSAAKE